MKFCAYAYHTPVSAILMAETKNKILTIENIVYPEPNYLSNIVKELRRANASIFIGMNEPLRIELGLRGENQFDLENPDVTRLASELYQVITEETRFLDKADIDIAKPFVWRSLCVLLNAAIKPLCHGEDCGTATSFLHNQNGVSHTQRIINEINYGNPFGLSALDQHHSRYFYEN